MEAAEHGVDSTDGPLRADNQVRPAGAGANGAVIVPLRTRARAPRSSPRRPLARPGAARGSLARRSRAIPRSARGRGLAALERGHAGVEHHRGDVHAAGHQPRDHLGRERPPGARHLGAAGFDPVHILVGGERPVGPTRGSSGSAARGAPGSRAGRGRRGAGRPPIAASPCRRRAARPRLRRGGAAAGRRGRPAGARRSSSARLSSVRVAHRGRGSRGEAAAGRRPRRARAGPPAGCARC